jgi:hypothetical protein
MEKGLFQRFWGNLWTFGASHRLLIFSRARFAGRSISPFKHEQQLNIVTMLVIIQTAFFAPFRADSRPSADKLYPH